MPYSLIVAELLPCGLYFCLASVRGWQPCDIAASGLFRGVLLLSVSVIHFIALGFAFHINFMQDSKFGNKNHDDDEQEAENKVPTRLSTVGHLNFRLGSRNFEGLGNQDESLPNTGRSKYSSYFKLPHISSSP